MVAEPCACKGQGLPHRLIAGTVAKAVGAPTHRPDTAQPRLCRSEATKPTRALLGDLKTQALQPEEAVPARLAPVRQRSQRAAPRQRAPWDSKDPRDAPGRIPSQADADPKEDERAERPQGAGLSKRSTKQPSLDLHEPAEPVEAPASGSHQTP